MWNVDRITCFEVQLSHLFHKPLVVGGDQVLKLGNPKVEVIKVVAGKDQTLVREEPFFLAFTIRDFPACHSVFRLLVGFHLVLLQGHVLASGWVWDVCCETWQGVLVGWRFQIELFIGGRCHMLILGTTHRCVVVVRHKGPRNTPAMWVSSLLDGRCVSFSC